MEIFMEENVKLKRNLMKSADLDESPLRMIQGFWRAQISTAG
ncbi:hypothetical protein [Paenibacillus phocaensis]|nr:hypothetical protein [Paenibacillus phocaensis]